MASAEQKSLAASGTLRRSMSSGKLRKSGEVTVNGTATLSTTTGEKNPLIPKYLSVNGLTRRRKLAKSTGNLHGYMAEDYEQIRWPLPKMFGHEKYGYSLIDIEDPRYVNECAGMSKKLVRLSYDQQIIDLEWRKTYKALLDAEHRQATLASNCPQKTKDLLKKEVDGCMKYLLELQQQKDLYESGIKEIYERCDAIKAMLKKESDLEDLRMYMEKQTQEKISQNSPRRTNPNLLAEKIRSQNSSRPQRFDYE